MHRAYRIGQTQPVDVYRLAAEGTVDMHPKRGAVKTSMAHSLLHAEQDTHLNAVDARGDALSVGGADGADRRGGHGRRARARAGPRRAGRRVVLVRRLL